MIYFSFLLISLLSSLVGMATLEVTGFFEFYEVHCFPIVWSALDTQITQPHCLT